MRKTLISILLMSAAVCAYAQDYYSAGQLNDNHYYGTARSLALGNAMTAVGGDVGSVTLNPAGSAVSRYSQFTLSPGLSVSTVSAQYSPANVPGPVEKSGKTSFSLPNFGLTLYWDTDGGSAVSGVSLGIVASAVNSYGRSQLASGLNPFSSLAGSLAAEASLSPDGYNANLNTLAAYRSYMISEGSIVGENQLYYGVTEADYDRIAGPLYQRSRILGSGSKNDLAFNLAFNMQDRWYAGINVGIIAADRTYGETFVESARDVELFPADSYEGPSFFDHLEYQYSLSQSVSAVYFKAGAIFLPFEGVRLGASVQTPMTYRIQDLYSVYASVDYVDGTYRDSGDNLTGEWAYTMSSPWKFSVGAAYTFRDRGFVSLDYEVEDYSSLSYKSDYSYDFTRINAVNSLFYGTRGMLRAGLEYRLTPALAVRLGYTRTSSPMRYYEDAAGNLVSADNFSYNDYYSGRLTLGNAKYFADRVKSYSFGLGYSSGGSFFADAAVRSSVYPSEVFMPYQDYLYDEYGYLATPSPSVSSTRRLLDVVVTLGWRF